MRGEYINLELTESFIFVAENVWVWRGGTEFSQSRILALYAHRISARAHSYIWTYSKQANRHKDDEHKNLNEERIEAPPNKSYLAPSLPRLTREQLLYFLATTTFLFLIVICSSSASGTSRQRFHSSSTMLSSSGNRQSHSESKSHARHRRRSMNLG